MKRKVTLGLVVFFALVAYLVGAWLIGTELGLEGRSAWILRGGLALLGVLVAVVALLYLLRKPAPPPPPKDALMLEVQSALAGAERKLAAARVAPAAALGKLPLVVMLGPPGSTKTSSVVRSGLDAELLTGDVFRDDAIVATRGVNLWFARNTLFVEPGRDIADEPMRWRWLIHRLQPARLAGALSSGQQAPRVAVVCYSCEGLTAAGAADAAVASARAIRDRLGQLAQQFGIRLPVYVVFSKADRIPGFAEYVQHFTREEARVVVGSTLPLASRSDGSSYADRESRRLTDAWGRLFGGLAARRIDVLSRENAGERKPAAYEFPREVRKMSGAAVQFLVELCRPTELGVGPVLRGFYLTGVRAVVTGDAAAAIPSLMPAREAQAVAATSVFRPVAGAAPMAQPPVAAGARRKPDWVFLTGLFPDVILADSVAMGVTRGGTRMAALRRTLAGVGVGLAAALAIAFTTSFLGNRRLQRTVGAAAASVAALPRETVALPSTDALQRLDSLREQVATLSRHVHEGPPFWLRWGLYSGGGMYQPVRALYFDRFARLLYDSTRVGLHRAAANLGRAGAGVPYDSAYRLVRAYLITTEAPEQSSADFLAPVLSNAWPQAQALDSAAREVAHRQFEFFGSELRWGNPYADRADALLVREARAVLARSSGIDPIYLSMLAEAARHGQPVRLGPVAAGALVNPAEVPGQFTERGWAFFVDTALVTQLDRFLQGEKWVTGGGVQPPPNRDQLARDLKQRYVSDYVAAWRRFVRAATVPGFGGLGDATRKLEVLAGPTSPLLAMLLTVSKHAAVDTTLVRPALQPVDVVMPLKNSETYIGGANQPYMDALGALAGSVRQAAAAAGPAAMAPLEQANGATAPARDAVRKLSVQFSQQAEAQLALSDLLLAPVLRTERLLQVELGGKQREADAKDVNAQMATLCEDVRAVLDKYPFASSARAVATSDDLARIFKPSGGRIAQFFEQSLQGKVLVRSGGGYRGAGSLAPTDQLVRFMTNTRRVSDALFPAGASEPRVQFTLRPQLTPSLPLLNLTFGDETFQFARGGEHAVTPTWRFSDSAYVGFSVPRRGANEIRENGAWAPFRMYWGRDSRSGGPNGGRLYDIALSGGARGTLEMTVGVSALSDPSVFSGLSCPAQAVR